MNLIEIFMLYSHSTYVKSNTSERLFIIYVNLQLQYMLYFEYFTMHAYRTGKDTLSFLRELYVYIEAGNV